MAQNQVVVSCPAGAWTELTNSDATTFSFQILSGPAEIKVSTSAAPGASEVGWRYLDGAGEKGVTLATFFGLPLGDRVFARPLTKRKSTILVGHA